MGVCVNRIGTVQTRVLRCQQAERSFVKAVGVAQTDDAKSWELRATTSLARLRQGERQKAFDLLFPVYDSFTEGFDTADLKDAKALLEELK